MACNNRVYFCSTVEQSLVLIYTQNYIDSLERLVWNSRGTADGGKVHQIEIRISKPETRNSKPETRNSKLETKTRRLMIGDERSTRYGKRFTLHKTRIT